MPDLPVSPMLFRHLPVGTPLAQYIESTRIKTIHHRERGEKYANIIKKLLFSVHSLIESGSFF